MASEDAEDVPDPPRKHWGAFIGFLAVLGLIAAGIATCTMSIGAEDRAAEEAEAAARARYFAENAQIATPVEPGTEPQPAASRQPSDEGVRLVSRTSMSLPRCLAVIRATATELGVAPTNIVETSAIRVVRFNTTTGSTLITCDGAQLLVHESPHTG